MRTKNWLVILDGEIDETFNTRKEARDYAKWLRRHPARIDRVLFHGMGVVELITRDQWKNYFNDEE